MARRADSLSVFVVQRSFRRVMRGYDPVEVEHHLERVSRWFSETGIHQEARKAEAKLHERERGLGEREDQGRRQDEEGPGPGPAALEEAGTEAATILETSRQQAAREAEATAHARV